MSRVAWLSPLPPEGSGIADYSAELLGELREAFRIELYCGEPTRLPASLAGLPARAYARMLDEHRRRPYDAIVYQVGNSPDYHAEIYRLLLREPGIVVLHEYMLHDLVRGLGDGAAFVEAMRYAYGGLGRRAAEQMLEGWWPSERWAYPLFEQAVDASRTVIVHGESTRQRVLRSRPGARVDVVPHHLSLDGLPPMDAAGRAALRRELGIPPDGLLVASFGHVTPSKRVDVALRAFARVRRVHPGARYVLAGEISPYYQEIRELLAGELGEGVIVTGRLPLDRMLAVMDVTDIAVNLRFPTGGETSGTGIRLLGLGAAVVVSAGDWFSEIPEGCCAHVAPGPQEEDELAAIVGLLAGDAALRRDMGAAAAAWARVRHDRAAVAASYADVIRRTIAEQPGRQGDPFAPPVEPDERAATGIALDVAEAAASLGVPASDAVLLPMLADELIDLGMTTR